jgi:hypothetical protein
MQFEVAKVVLMQLDESSPAIMPLLETFAKVMCFEHGNYSLLLFLDEGVNKSFLFNANLNLEYTDRPHRAMWVSLKYFLEGLTTILLSFNH